MAKSKFLSHPRASHRVQATAAGPFGTDDGTGGAPNDPSFILRDARPSDLAEVCQLERLAFANPWSIASFQRELTLPFSRIVVACRQQDGKSCLAGFLCRWSVADECHILNVAVHPEFRRQGIARALLTEAIEEARGHNARFVTLEVRRSNIAARRLYRKLNFVEQRLRRNYYGFGEDAIVLELKLA